MKQFVSFSILCSICLFCFAQTQEGIHFEKGLDWDQVRGKAKSENKYIFIDCYTTWCGPCRSMDKNVYSNDSVGDYLNDRFVSLKLQMDTTKKDSPEIQRFYSTVNEICAKYNVRLYPTFLFFSPQGVLVHKGVGAKSVRSFIRLASESIEPNLQYFTLLERYKAQMIDYASLPRLADLASQFKETDLSLKIASDYISSIVNRFNSDSLCVAKNLFFINKFRDTLTSKNKAFKYIFNNRKKVDSVVNDNHFSQKLIDYVIVKEEITPSVYNASLKKNDVDWSDISRKIESKYGRDFMERNILEAKSDFYFKKEKWSLFTKFLVKKIDNVGIENLKDGMFDALYLNNSAWSVFKYSHKRRELRRALAWSERALQLDTISYLYPGNMDTKANLLYKLGEVNEAIIVEERAVFLSRDNAVLKGNLHKMKNGMPTWN